MKAVSFAGWRRQAPQNTGKSGCIGETTQRALAMLSGALAYLLKRAERAETKPNEKQTKYGATSLAMFRLVIAR